MVHANIGIWGSKCDLETEPYVEGEFGFVNCVRPSPQYMFHHAKLCLASCYIPRVVYIFLGPVGLDVGKNCGDVEWGYDIGAA